jgi:hypothetical protein
MYGTRNSSTTTGSLVAHKSSAKLVHGWRMELRIHQRIIYSWLRNHWWNLNHCRPRNHQHNQVLQLTHGIISAYNLLLTQKLLMKTESLLTQKSSIKSISLPIQKLSAMIELFLVLFFPSTKCKVYARLSPFITHPKRIWTYTVTNHIQIYHKAIKQYHHFKVET